MEWWVGRLRVLQFIYFEACIQFQDRYTVQDPQKNVLDEDF